MDHEAERTLYKEFASAAASVSQLFSSAVAQQRKATAQGSRQALVREARFEAPPGLLRRCMQEGLPPSFAFPR